MKDLGKRTQYPENVLMLRYYQADKSKDSSFVPFVISHQDTR